MGNDLVVEKRGGLPVRYKDMGDGTYAEVTSVSATIETGDLEIGAVELKDGATNNRAVIDASGNVSVTVANLPASIGQKTAAASLSVVLSSDGPGTTSLAAVAKSVAGNYETVAASQTDQVMGSAGAVGDFLRHVLVVPASTSPGAVLIKDGDGSAIIIFAGGALSVASLAPIIVPLGLLSTSGSWKITTGASVSAIGVGSFS